MPQRNVLIIITLITIMVSISACKLPSTETPPESQPEISYTQAVETVSSQLTESAEESTTTQEPTGDGHVEKNTLEPTFTQIIPERTPTPIPTKTPTPTLTFTPSSNDPLALLGEATWIDVFDDESNWNLSSGERSSMRVEDGKFIMVAHNADFYDSWALSWPTIDEFYIEMKAESGICDFLDHYGLLIRSPGPKGGGYLIAISCDGRYSVWIWDGQQKIILVDWLSSDHIRKGNDQVNRVGIWAQDDGFALFINGHKIDEFTDDQYSSGYFGLFIGSTRTTGYTVYVDELAYWEFD
jgi:hypothetical protein